MTPVQACGGVHGGTSADGQGGGVHGVKGARLQVHGILDGGCRPWGPEAAVCGSAGGFVPGPCEGQALCGGHGSPRSCSCRGKIESGQCTLSCEVTLPSARRQGGSDGICHGTRSTSSPTTRRQTFRGHRCMRCWCPGRTSRTRRRCPRSPTGWRRWCRPSTSASVPGWLGTTLRSGSGPAWYRRSHGLFDRQLRRVTLAVTERRSVAVFVGSKQLARVQGDDAQGHVTEAMFSLPERDDNLAADARHSLDTCRGSVKRTTLGSRVHQGPGAGQD